MRWSELPKTLIESHRELIILIVSILSFAFHVISFLVEKTSPDMETWIVVAKSVLSGQDFYLATSPPLRSLPYTYPPIWALILGSLAPIVNPQADPISYLIAVRLALMLGNFMVGLMVLRSSKNSLPYFVFWMLNPIVIGVSQSGQFDVLPSLASILAYANHKRGRGALAGFLIGLGFSLKVWPIFLIPAFIADRPKDERNYSLLFIGAACVTAVAISLPFALTTRYLDNFTKEVGLSLPGLAGQVTFSPVMLYLLFMLMFIAIIYYKFDPDLLPFSCLIVSLLLVLRPNNVQYAMWLMPFLIMYVMEEFSKTIAIILNALWAAHFLQRYSNTIFKFTGLSTGFPTEIFDAIYAAIAIYFSWRIVKEGRAGVGRMS